MCQLVMAINWGLLLVPQEGSLSSSEALESSQGDARALAMTLLALLIFVLVFLVATYAIVRASRRFRESLAKQKPEHTEAGDVWAMHKVPEELETDGEDEAATGDGNGE